MTGERVVSACVYISECVCFDFRILIFNLIVVIITCAYLNYASLDIQKMLLMLLLNMADVVWFRVTYHMVVIDNTLHTVCKQ